MTDQPFHLSDLLGQAVLEAVPCAIILMDADHRILHWNRSAEQLTGFAADEMVGGDCERLRVQLAADQDPEVLRALCPVGSSEGFDEQCRIRRKDGQIVPVVRKAQEVRDAAGHVIATVQALVDVSSIERARQEIRTLRQEVARGGRLGPLIGSSAPMRKLFEAIRTVAATDAGVVLEGETGTGKELVARTIHAESPRAGGLFLAVNCGALPEGLLEAELFGHVRGAFTGAVADRAGRFEEAHGGTLLLDEVTEMPLASQVKLLRAIQEREVTRLGESRPRQTDVRILAATNRDLKAQVAAGAFREDLFYRLRVVHLVLPPLRERREDIPDLVAHFLERLNPRYGRQIAACSAAALHALIAHDWPGNVRQLEHALEHAFVVTPPDRALIEADALPPEIALPERQAPPVPRGPNEEKQKVLQALREAGGNKAAAARALGITRAGLYKRLQRLGIEA